MARKKTSFMVEEELWTQWMHFVLDHYGSSRKASEALADAMREYMEKRKQEIVAIMDNQKTDSATHITQ